MREHAGPDEVDAAGDDSGDALRLRPLSAPAGGALAVCPHCWHVNLYAERLCGRCGADMTLLLQESGGLRRTAPVQSPVPVQVAGRLRPATRVLLLLLTALLAIAWVVAPLLGVAPQRQLPAPRGASSAPGGHGY